MLMHVMLCAGGLRCFVANV